MEEAILYVFFWTRNNWDEYSLFASSPHSGEIELTIVFIILWYISSVYMMCTTDDIQYYTGWWLPKERKCYFCCCSSSPASSRRFLFCSCHFVIYNNLNIKYFHLRRCCCVPCFGGTHFENCLPRSKSFVYPHTFSVFTTTSTWGISFIYYQGKEYESSKKKKGEEFSSVAVWRLYGAPS